MILIFDLDDTLYDEITYVHSGFRAVANYLQKTYQLTACESLEFMIHELERNGRGLVFNRILEKHKLLTRSRVRKCLSVYRLHHPDIRLKPETVHCLERFKNHPKYIVTDGNKLAQKNKILALGLERQVNKVFITHNYGIKYSKPSPYCFKKIVNLEQSIPQEIVYVADNPNKDFIEIKKLGFRTIRINNGMFKDQVFDDEHEAGHTVQSLNELTIELLTKLWLH